jgi:hypothetical protein
MKLYYFFCVDKQGMREYGEQFFVVSDSLENAKNAVINSKEYKELDSNIKHMDYTVHGVNEVVQTELA